MADDFDVEAMLEAPYRQEADVARDDRDRESDRRRKGRDSDRDRDRDRDRKRDRSRERRRSRSRDKKRSRSRDRERRKRSRSRSRDKRGRSRSKDRRKRKSRTPPHDFRLPTPDLTPEERDARTVFCMQLAARIRPRDIEDFFSAVGKVKDVRIIMDNKTRRSKGIAYIEFKDTESVPLALGLTGQRLLGVPIIVQASQAEKNRSAMGAAPGIVPVVNKQGPMRLYVGSLHFNITEDMLKGIFEPFGKVTEIKLIRDHETNRSHGYGFVTFQNSEESKKALEQLNGFELAGRPMKVGHVTERTAGDPGSSFFDNDEMDRAGVDLGATGRLQLMAKLAEGTGFQIPQAAANALNMGPGGVPVPAPAPVAPPPNPAMGGFGMNPSITSTPPIATQCFMLSNMFDPAMESSPNWENEVRDDVIEECNKHGGVLHIYVDKASLQGNVYVKCPTISAAVASVGALHGRYFAGRVITAAYVPLPNYHQLFEEALRTTQLLMPSKAMNAFAMNSGIVAVSPFT